MLAIVTGFVGTFPLGGIAFHYLQYALGLRALGWDVVYLEDTGKWMYNPRRETFVEDPAVARRYLQKTTAGFGLGDSWCFRDPSGDVHGPAAPHLPAILDDADLFLNLSGSCWLRPEYRECGRLVYVDTDPGYTQFKIARARASGADPDLLYSIDRMQEHDFHATYAESIGSPGCSLPAEGFDWITTRQPIVLDLWKVRASSFPIRFTTVFSWNAYAEPLVHDGKTYRGKEPELYRMLRLPASSGALLELAVSGRNPNGDLRELGWQVRPAIEVSDSADGYAGYISSSGAEFAVAKDVYVDTRCGWFSERTACYLASGKPAVVQETGWSEHIPTGVGLHAFATFDEAVDGIGKVEANYEEASAHARAIAEEYFDARLVLGDLLTAIGL